MSPWTSAAQTFSSSRTMAELVISQRSAARTGQASSRTVKDRERAHFTSVFHGFEADLYTWRGAAGRRSLHAFEGRDSQQIEADLQGPGGEVAQSQTRGAGGGLGIEDWAGLIECHEAAGQVVEIVAEEIGEQVFGDLFDGFGQLEDAEGESSFGRLIE